MFIRERSNTKMTIRKGLVLQHMHWRHSFIQLLNAKREILSSLNTGEKNYILGWGTSRGSMVYEIGAEFLCLDSAPLGSHEQKKVRKLLIQNRTTELIPVLLSFCTSVLGLTGSRSISQLFAIMPGLYKYLFKK